jgi:hypothetical protein
VTTDRHLIQILMLYICPPPNLHGFINSACPQGHYLCKPSLIYFNNADCFKVKMSILYPQYIMGHFISGNDQNGFRGIYLNVSTVDNRNTIFFISNRAILWNSAYGVGEPDEVSSLW